MTCKVVEDDSKYWEVVSSALAVGWLQIVVSSFESRLCCGLSCVTLHFHNEKLRNEYFI